MFAHDADAEFIGTVEQWLGYVLAGVDDHRDGDARFREAIAAQLKGLGELIEHVVAAPGTPAERCACFLEAYVGGGQLNRDNVQLMVLANLGTERGQPRIALERAFAAEAARLTVLFDGFTDPEIAVSMLVGTANDLLFRALDGLPPPADYAQRVVRLLLPRRGGRGRVWNGMWVLFG